MVSQSLLIFILYSNLQGKIRAYYVEILYYSQLRECKQENKIDNVYIICTKVFMPNK